MTGVDGGNNRRWYMLSVLFVARFAMGFQFQSIAASAPSIAADLHLDPARIGVLIGLYMLPGVVIALPGGVVTRRFGDKPTCLAGLVLMVTGSLIATIATGSSGLAAGRVLGGAGAVIFNLVLTNMAVSWFAGREVVTALAVILASWPCSIAAALIAETALAEADGWRAVMAGTAVLAAVAFALVARLYRVPEQPAQPVSERRTVGLTMRQAAASTTAGLLWGCFNAGLVVFYSFTPPMLREAGWRLLDAGSITSLGLWVSMASLPLGGWLIERWGRPGFGIIAACFTAGCAMLLLPTLVFPWGLSLAVGVAIGPGAGAIVALPARAVAPAQRSVAFGLFYTAYYVLVAVGPVLAGYGQTAWGTAQAGVLTGGALFLTGVPLLAIFSALGRQSADTRASGTPAAAPKVLPAAD
jgi:predicted MFS family arabinose efflux permease